MASTQELTERLIDAFVSGELTASDLVAQKPPSPEIIGQAWRLIITLLRERACTTETVRAIEILCAHDPGFTDGTFILGMANYELGRFDAATAAFERHCDQQGARADAARRMIDTVAALRARVDAIPNG